eukprot:TRINITY_DN2504_c0_g1_i1.p1 TRINITY_DN2504_c0_g1~~TRINITY_DN2504_c0_g1_i1.p1  ORF type:complete len:151 (-),score=21.88 TRINITY_DN2504_c0_g1_i1:146-598(-)
MNTLALIVVFLVCLCFQVNSLSVKGEVFWPTDANNAFRGLKWGSQITITYENPTPLPNPLPIGYYVANSSRPVSFVYTGTPSPFSIVATEQDSAYVQFLGSVFVGLAINIQFQYNGAGYELDVQGTTWRISQLTRGTPLKVSGYINVTSS